MKRINVIVGCVVTVSMFLGCGISVIDPYPPDTPPSLTSPAGTIELIEESFSNADIDELGKCFAADFTFHFDEDDVGKQVGEYIIPESWTSDDFFNAVDSMFGDAYAIDASFSTSNVGTPGADDTVFTADKVLMQFIVMVDPVTGYVAQGAVTFELMAEYNEKNEKEWLVTAWRDFTSTTEPGGSDISEESFGEILARYHKP
jgi:hypothetical protein